VSEAINDTIPSAKSSSSTFPHWFLRSLVYYIKKKSLFYKK
jgi:hypothetical protein